MFSTLSLGAVGAGLIAAVVSVIGLIVTKEAKTSDFRQAWVDSLRSEIGQFLVNLNAIADASQQKYSNFPSRLDRVGPLAQKMNEAVFAISLRLNSKEKESQDVIAAISGLQNLVKTDGTVDFSALRPLEADLLIKSSALLKKEWRRVKRGEPIFFLLKYALLGAIFAAFAVLIFRTEGGGAPRQEAQIEKTGQGALPSPNVRSVTPITPTQSH